MLGVLATFLFGVDALVEFLMLAAEVLNLSAGFRLRLRELKQLGAKRVPGTDLGNEIAGAVIEIGSIGRKGGGLRLIVGGFMNFQQLLDGGFGIGAGAEDVFLGVVELVLIKFELGLGNVELVLQFVFLGIGGGGKLLADGSHESVVGGDGGFGLRAAGKELLILRSDGRRILLSVADGVGEGEVNFVVAELLRLTVELLLFGGGDDGSKRAGDGQRMLVDVGASICSLDFSLSF